MPGFAGAASMSETQAHAYWANTPVATTDANQHQNSVWHNFSQLWMTPLGIATNLPGIKQTLGGVNDVLGPVWDFDARLASTGLVALNPASKDYLSLGDAWRDASQVSPGQAFWSNPFNPLGQMFGHGFWWDYKPTLFGQRTGTFGGIDPTDPVVRRAAFESGGGGEIASWGTDASFQFFMDPTIVGGKFAKPLIAVSRGAAIGRGGKAAFAVGEAATEATGAAERGKKIAPILGPLSPRQATVEQKLAGAGAVVGQEAPGVATSTFGRAMQSLWAVRDDPLRLASDYVIRKSSNPALLSGIISSLRVYSDYADVIAAAMGDPVALSRLGARNEVLAQAVDRAQGNLERQVAAHEMGGLTLNNNAYTQAAEAIERQRSFVESLKTQSDALSRALEGGPLRQGIYGSMSTQAFSPLRQFNRLREATAANRAAALSGSTAIKDGYYTSRVFRPIAGSTAAVLMRWMGTELPSGHIALDGPLTADAAGEITAMATQAGLGRDAINTHLRNWENAATPPDRVAALESLHTDVMRSLVLKRMGDIAAKRGVPLVPGSKLYEDSITFADKFAADHGARTSKALDQMREGGGWIKDADSDQMVQFTNYDDTLRPLMDVKIVDRALKRLAADENGQRLRQMVQGGAQLTEMTAGAFMHVWKPAILLRMGALPKNVGESYLASFVYTSRMPGNAVAGTARWAQNRWYRNIVNNPINPLRITAKNRVKLIKGQIDDAVEQRAVAQEAHGQAVDALANVHLMPTPRGPGGRFIAKDVVRQQLQDSIDTHAATMSTIDDALDQMRTDLGTVMGGPVLAKRARKFAGQKALVSRRGADVTARGSAQGEMTDVIMKSVSAGPKTQVISSSFNSQGQQLAMLAEQLRASGRLVDIDPSHPRYFDQLAEWANTDVRGNRVATALLRGDDIHDLRDWLQGTGEGKQLRDNMGLSDDPDELINELLDLNDNLRATLPHEALQQAVVNGAVSPGQVRGFLYGKDLSELQPVRDMEMLRQPWVKGGPLYTINRLTDKGFDVMWTMPEDRLARWPLYDQIYRANLQNNLDRFYDHITGLNAEEADRFIRRLEGQAHSRARTDVTRVIYSAGRRTPVAQKLRFISAFYQVTQNRLAYYGSQFLENPQNMARVFVGWNAIGSTKDRDGNDVVTVSLPGFVQDMPGMSWTRNFGGMQFNKSSLNLINSGEPWYSPGFAPPVTVPLAEWLRRHPQETPDWVKTLVGNKGLGLFPNNYYGVDAASLISPAWVNRMRGKEGQQFVNTQAQLYAQELMKYRQGLRAEPPTNAEVVDKTNQLWFFRIAASFLLPAQPTLQPGGSPQGEALKHMIDVHSQFLKQYGKDGDNQFLNAHPEWYDYMISLTTNPSGITATNDANRRADRYGPLADTLEDPKMAGLIFNTANDYGKFEADAYAYQQGRPITEGSPTLLRGSQEDYRAGIENRIISHGWADYVKAVQQRDSLLKLNGYASITSKDAEWVKIIYDSKIKKILKDTSWQDQSGNWVSPWWDAFNQENRAKYVQRSQSLERIIDAPGYYQANIGAQPWLASAAVYLKTRNDVGLMLADQKAAGGSDDINAQDNLWIKMIWDARRKLLANADPQWAQIQAGFFAHDDLSTFPLDEQGAPT